MRWIYHCLLSRLAKGFDNVFSESNNELVNEKAWSRGNGQRGKANEERFVTYRG
jgi:hypothetical protein